LFSVAPVRPLPVKVTLTMVPRKPDVGAIEVRFGVTTVNGTPLLMAPPVVATVTVLLPSVAVGAIAKLAVTVVSLTTTMPLAMTPVPDTSTPAVPDRPVPVRVTATLPLREPDEGVIAVSVGAPATPAPPVASIAPMSKVVGVEGSGLG
jgi:hypothetical protein